MSQITELWEKYKKIVLVVVTGIMVLIIGLFAMDKPKEVKKEQPKLAMVKAKSDTKKQVSDEKVKPEKIYIDIKGAVKNPGMYEMSSKQRVFDAIQKAGGLLAEADQNRINMAGILTDQMVIYVVKQDEEMPKELDYTAAKVGQETIEDKTNDKININTADAAALQTLNGIGEKKAAQIVQYREENGSFQTVEDLKKVSGIGEKIFAGLVEQITTD